MTKVQALKEFRSVDIGVSNDRVSMREAWGIYTDLLCKDGYITLKQYESWTNPF
jgi:hypothetical protein